jgi:hypothetical protein
MIVFITTGYGKNVIGGSDIWCNNFVKNILPLVDEEYKIIIDGRPYNDTDKNALYTFGNETEVSQVLDKCDKIVFLHHSYRWNKIIDKYLHKTYLTFVHAYIPDLIGLNSNYENIMTKLDWEWQEKILNNSQNIVWIGYENDTIHSQYPKTKTVTNYYEFRENIPFLGILSDRIGYAARCETRKNPHYLDNLPSFVFSNKYDYLRMLEGSKIDNSRHQFIEFNYKFHKKFFDKNFQIFHACYQKEPFGYAGFDAIDNGKLPIIHTDWMKHIEYKWRAGSKEEFMDVYKKILNTSLDENGSEFNKLKEGLKQYDNKSEWIKQICSYLIKH